jgi:hypothetical protein
LHSFRDAALEEIRKVCVHTLVTGNEFIGEYTKARHKTTPRQPEDRGERSREENPLDSSEGYQVLSKAGLLVRNPPQCPVSFALDARNGFNGVEKIVALGRVCNIGVDKKGIGFRVDALHHDLEAIETTRLGGLYLVRKSFDQISIDNAIGGREE